MQLNSTTEAAALIAGGSASPSRPKDKGMRLCHHPPFPWFLLGALRPLLRGCLHAAALLSISFTQHI